MPPLWKSDLAQAKRSSADLLAILPPQCAQPFLLRSSFPVLCTLHYAQKIGASPDDPLLRQVLATPAEEAVVPGFVSDPVGDAQAEVEPGLLHKYTGRLLLVTTGSCSVNCRFCFRRNFPYGRLESHSLPARLEQWLNQHPDTEEVIFSGGEPLLLEDAPLQALFAVIAAHSGVQRVRIHTRTPLTLPSRFSADLLGMLSALGSRLVLVVHCNHPRELDACSAAVFAALRSAGATLLNQSVLLRGVNDAVSTLAELSRELFCQGVLPYYLHQLDRAAGASHFEVPEAQGRVLMEALRRELPGYLVPRWVREEAGTPGKTPLF